MRSHFMLTVYDGYVLLMNGLICSLITNIMIDSQVKQTFLFRS